MSNAFFVVAVLGLKYSQASLQWGWVKLVLSNETAKINEVLLNLRYQVPCVIGGHTLKTGVQKRCSAALLMSL